MNNNKTLNFNSLLCFLGWFILLLLIYKIQEINLERPFWIDEVYSVLTANVDNLYELLSNYYQGCDTNPPLYFLLLHIWIKIFGENVAAIKILSFLFVVIGLFFLLKIELLKESEKILCVAVFFVSTYVSFYLIREARAYSLQFCLASLVIYLYSKNDNSCSYKRIWKVSVVNTLLLYTHYYSIFYVGAMIFLDIWKFIKTQDYKKIGISVLPLALFLPWIPAIINQASAINMLTSHKPPTLANLANFFIFYYSNNFFLFFFLLFSTIVLFFLPFEKNNIKKKRMELKNKAVENKFFFIRLLLFLIIPFIFIIISSKLSFFKFYERYFGLSYISIFIFLSYLLQKSRKQAYKTFYFFFVSFLVFIQISYGRKEKDETKTNLENYLFLLNYNNLAFENPYYFYPLYFYASKIYKKNFMAYYVIDFESSKNNTKIINDLADYVGAVNVRKFFKLPFILTCEEFEEKIDSCFFINDEDRFLFERKFINNPKYELNFVTPHFIVLKKNKKL